jgi:hypothetical protein
MAEAVGPVVLVTLFLMSVFVNCGGLANNGMFMKSELDPTVGNIWILADYGGML